MKLQVRIFLRKLRKHLNLAQPEANPLRCVTTEMINVMYGVENDLVGQIYKAYKNVSCLNSMVILQVLCRNYLNASCY